MSTPDEIKVGDVVEHKEFTDTEWSGAFWEVLAVCGKHAWIRYKDKEPRSTYIKHLRKPTPKPVVVETVRYGHVNKFWEQAGYNPFSLGFYRGPNDTHKITFNIIDGVPDCSSVKMEKM